MFFDTIAATAAFAIIGAQAQGEFITAETTYFGAGGCTPAATSDTEPVFGETSPNLCLPIRSTLGSVVSVNATYVMAGCNIHYYTDLDCTKGDTIGVIGHCEQANAPFVALTVSCPATPAH